MNTETETIDFQDLTDAELQAMAVEYRKRAQQSIEAARLPGPCQSSHSRHANRMVKLYLAADIELNRRARLQCEPPKPEEIPDPLPPWLAWSVGILLAGVAWLLLVKSGAV